jgi:hypothetical protein
MLYHVSNIKQNLINIFRRYFEIPYDDYSLTSGTSRFLRIT